MDLRIRTPQSAGVLVWTALLATAIYLVLVGGNTVLVRDANSRVMLQVLAGVILGLWLVGSLVRPRWRTQSPLVAPVLLATAAYVIAALLSQRPRLSLEPAIGGIGWAFGYLLLSRILKDSWFRARVASALTLFVLLIAVAYVAQVVLEWVTWWQVVGALEVPPLRPSWARLIFNSPNDIPAMLSLSAPLVVVLVGRRHSWAAAGIGSLALLAAFISGSRGAFLGLSVMAVLALVLAVATGIGGNIAFLVRSGLRRRSVVGGSLCIAALAIVFAPALATRLAQGGDDVRFDLWRSALAIFVAHPLTGSGPGTWVQLKVLTNPPGVPNNIYSGAHNDFVQAAAEIGLLGLMAFGYLSFAVVRRLSVAMTGRGPLTGEALAVFVGLTGFAVQCLFENLALRPLMNMLVLVGVAWVDAAAPLRIEGEMTVAPKPPSRSMRAAAIAVPAIGLASLAVSAGILVWSDAAAFEDAQGTAAVWNGDWESALSHFEAARAIDRGMTIYALRAASAHARLGEVEQARRLLQDAVAVDPVPVNILGAGSLDAAIDGPAAGLDEAREAVRMGPGSPTVALNAGLLAEAAGDREFALEQFANAIAFDPPLAGSGLWASSDRLVPFDEVIGAALSRTDPLTGGLILGYAGRDDEARARLHEAPPSIRRERYTAVLDWLDGQVEAARSRLSALLDNDPLDWLSAAWLARVERLSGHAAAAARYEAWAMTVQADRAPGVIFEASVVPAQDDAATAGLPAAYPSTIYFRDTGGFLLMPGLTLIGYR